MANTLGSRLARVDVLIGGADQAKRKLQEMRDEASKLAKEAENAKKAMAESVDTVDYDKNKAVYEKLTKQQKDLQKSIYYSERNINTVEKYLSDISGQTLRNLNNAQRSLKQILLGVDPKDLNSIKAVQDLIKQVSDEIQRRKGNIVEFSDIIGDIGNVSDKSLGLAKQRLQELVNSTRLNTEEIQKYRDQLAQVEAEETRRVSLRAQTTLGKVQTGTFDGTISQTKEAIKLLEQYKQQLKTSDTKGIKDVESAINTLNEKVKNASFEVSSLDEAILRAGKVGSGSFDGTYDDLQRLKKILQDYQKQLKVSDTKTLERIRLAFKDIESAEQAASGKLVNIDDVLKRINVAPLEELNQAAAQLQKELTESERRTEEYVETSAKLRRVNEEIQEIKESWKEQENPIVAATKRVKNYLLAYMGINEVISRIGQLVRSNLDLSDSMADIQKTTGLTAEEISGLTKSIDQIDTRTAQAQLYSLAASAGQAGLKTQEDVIGFVRAADQLTIALNELGNEGVNTLLKISNLTGDGKLLGTEKALLAIGSSINELSAAGAATAGPITDIISRIGSVGSAAKLSMADMAAYGATMDELGQSAEVSGTAFNAFLTSLQTNTKGISVALGISDKELEKMMDAGNTMEAVILVLERLKQMSQDEGGLRALAPLMKEFGSEGERMNTTINTMVNNVDLLRQRVSLSRQAYQEATSVTNEANVKQESAIGIVNRLGNAIKETFVNSGAVESLKEFLSTLLDFVKWLKSGTAGAEAFKTSVSSIVLGLASFTIAVKVAGAAIFTASTYTTLWKEGFAALNNTMKKNVIGLVVAGLISLGFVVYDLLTKVSDITKATNDYNKELEQERLRVNALFEGAKKENQEKDVKLKLINQINDRYGDYIGFLLTEADSNEKLSAAQELVNAKIRERLSLLLKEKLQEQAAEKTASGVSTALGSIKEGFEDTRGISDVRSDEALRVVQQIVNKDIKKPVDEIVKQVYATLKEKFSTKGNAYTYQDFFKVSEGIRDYINVLKDYDKAIDAAVSETEEKINAANQDVKAANTKMLNAITSEWNELQKVKTDSLDENQLSEHNEKLKKAADQYVKIAKQQISLLSGEEKQQLQSYVDFYEKAISQVEKTSKEKEPNIWGYGKTIDDASVDQLVAKYKELFAERASMREDADYSTAYAKEFKDRAEAMDWYMKKLKEIEAQLNKMGYNTSGKLLDDESGSRGEKKKMNDEISAAMSALEAYFLRRQQAIRQAYLDEQITTEEMNRQIDATEEEHLLARVELSKKLLGEENTFNQNLYGMEGKNLESTAALIKKLGERQTDGLRKNLEKDLLEVQNMAVKYRQTIEKELLKYNPFESLVNQFEESLDKLRLLNTDAEKEFRMSLGFSGVIDESAVKERINALVSLSEDAYNMNEIQLRGRLLGIDKIWAESMSPEQMSLMLKKLRDFYQDSKAAAEKYAKDIKEMIDVQWETSGNQKLWEDRIKGADDQSELMGAAGNLGLASTQSSFLGTSDTDNAELEALRIRLEAARQYYEEFYARKEELIQQAIASGATEQQAEESYRMAEKEALDALTQAREEQQSKELEITESKLSTLKNYTDAVVDFSEQMGEAAFSEVSDRKEAAKQLLQTMMKLTKDLIMQKVQELVMKKALNAQEVAQESATSATITAVHGSQAITDLTVQGAKTAADVSAGTASGAAKTIGQLGWWGIPLVAVISAALSALMGLAMSKLNKSKQEVAAATGVSSSKGRVATGMLTYAEGDYPVLGNDGQIYNARYQKELKTGVYGGGAHFGIFSEKKPEMIVDGDTTQKLILNYPHIYDSILTIARHGQLKSAAMPTFASGSYPSMPAQASQAAQQAGGSGMSAAEMSQVLTGVTDAVNALTQRLNQPISAMVDPYGRKGAVNQLSKASKFMNKNGLTN